MRTCTPSTPTDQISAAPSPPPGAPPRASPHALLPRDDARWLVSLHPWAGAIVRTLGVQEEDIADLVLDAFARVAARWSAFVAPDEVPARIARRRWIAHVLFQEAATARPSRPPESPPGAPAAPPTTKSAALDSTQALLTVPELRRRLGLSTAAVRWRVWLAWEVDATPFAEIARQEGQPLAKVRRLLERARTDLAVALARRRTAAHAPPAE